jgi:uncharacterized phiE125 gp8 family phage protein
MKFVLNLGETKAFTRLSDSTEDGVLTLCLETAHFLIEAFLGQKLLTQECVLPIKPIQSRIKLPYGPVQCVTSVTAILPTLPDSVACQYTWKDQTVDVILPEAIKQKSQSLIVAYKCGYGDNPQDVPAPIRQAILMACADLFEHRGDVPATERPWQKLAAPYRRIFFE